LFFDHIWYLADALGQLLLDGFQKNVRNRGTVFLALTTQHSDHHGIGLMADDRFFSAQAVHKRSLAREGVVFRRRLRKNRLMRSVCVGGVLMLAGLCETVQGAFFSGRDLQVPLREIRKGQPLTLAQMQALGYVQGVYDANAGLLFCSREDVDAGQVVKAVNAYLFNHPELLEQPASVGLTAAMISQWPCRHRG
jgi:hypothetical protein